LNGCTKSQTILVDITNTLSSAIDPVNPLCANESPVQLTAANGGGTWSGTGVNNAGVFNPQLAGVGTHTITYTIPGSCGSSSSLDIQVLEAPVATATYNGPICEGENLIMNGSIPTTSYTAYWSSSGNIISNEPVDTFSNVSVTLSGTYWYNIEYANGCKDSVSVNVLVRSMPVISNAIVTNKSCSDINNGSIDLTISGSGYSITWSNSANSEDISNLTEGTYTVTVDNSGCSVQQSYTITSPEALEITLVKKNNPTCNNTNGSILISVTGGTPSYTYQWQPGVSNDSIANNLSEGTYVIQVTDQAGCSTSLSVNLPCIEDSLVIPQLVTPNGDGKNDVWEIDLSNYPNNVVKIFNRWGNLVFSANPYLPNNYWDGKVGADVLLSIGNEYLPVGTYYYVIDLYGDGSKIYKNYIELQY
jgi:gliding motility-associated-like protein